MPMARLWSRVRREPERREAERADEEQRWMLGQWIQARSVAALLRNDKPLPPTKAEHERKTPNWPEIHRGRRQEEKFKDRWSAILADPRKFGAYHGLPHVLGEPQPDEPERPKGGLVADFASRLERRLGAGS